MPTFPSLPALSVRLLSAQEIEALSTSCDFARALPSPRAQIVTTEICPGEDEERMGIQAWDARRLSRRAPGWRFAGRRLVPPVPEADRKYWPESEWAGWTESFDYIVHGVQPEGGSAPFLLFRSVGNPFGSQLFVAMPWREGGASKLFGAREIASGVFALFHASIPALSALAEAEDLRGAVPGAPGAAEGGRL